MCDGFSSGYDIALEKINFHLPTFVGQSHFDADVIGSHIDHIYVSGGIKVISLEIIDDRRLNNNLLPSDHRPIFAKLSINKNT